MNKIDTLTKKLSQNLDKLEAFALVAKHGSVSRASQDAHLSQSALSHLISKLESSLDLTLFKRKSFGLELTDSGTTVFEFTKRLFLDVENLASRLCLPDSKAPIKIRVGTHETLAAHIWPKIIEAFSAKNSTLSFSLFSGRVDELIETLLRGDLHLIMSVEPRSDSRIKSHSLYTGKLKFYIGVNWKPKTKKNITAEDLSDTPIFTDVLAHTRQGVPIPHALASVGFSDLGQFEVGSFEAAINMASKNLGIAVIPDRNAEQAVREKRLKAIPIKNLKNPDDLNYQICISYLTNSPKAALYEKTIHEMQQIVVKGS